MCGGERDEHDGDDTEQHEEQIAKPQVARVLALGPHEVAHGGKLDPHPRATAHEMYEQRHRGSGAGEQPEWREEAHRYGASCRAEKARRSATPKGASVMTGSYEAP
jgi:hypothetical protein